MAYKNEEEQFGGAADQPMRIEDLGKLPDDFLRELMSRFGDISPETSVHRIVDGFVNEVIRQHVGIDTMKQLFQPRDGNPFLQHILMQDIARVCIAHFDWPDGDLPDSLPNSLIEKVVIHVVLYFISSRNSGTFHSSLARLKASLLPKEIQQANALFYSERFFRFLTQLFDQFITDLIDANFTKKMQSKDLRRGYFSFFAENIVRIAGTNQEAQQQAWEHLFYDALMHGVSAEQLIAIIGETLGAGYVASLQSTVRGSSNGLTAAQNYGYQSFLRGIAERAQKRVEHTFTLSQNAINAIAPGHPIRDELLHQLSPRMLPHIFSRVAQECSNAAADFARECCHVFFSTEDGNERFYVNDETHEPELSEFIFNVAAY